MSVLLFLGWAILAIIIMIGCWFVLSELTNRAFGQNITPPITPTPVPTPTPTAPNPNFQYLPQKAAVQVYTPEVGIPQNVQPLQVVPQVVPAPVQQSVGGFDFGTIMGVISAITAGGALVKSKLVGDKTNKVEATSQQNAEMNVQQATIQQKTLEQVYENMPDKGNSINDKPEIQLNKVADVKDEALKTASKA